jgi:kojibiose phosphorylase
MARFALQLAAEMGEAGGASKEECAAFADTGARLPIPRAHDGKLVLQSEDFERLAEPRFDLWKDRGNMYCNQVSHERMHRSKAIKQADVLLLMTMYPGEFTDAEVRYAWDYYIPYTTHDSSLSAGIHAMAAIRLGMREEAWKFWQRSAGLDLNVASGQANEGIHIAGAGSNWMIAVCGFGGMRTAVQSETLTFNPKLPTAWTRLAFPINWKGSQVYVEITDGQCAITNQSAQPLTVCVQGRQADIPAGETMPFIYDNQWVEVPALA